MPPAIRSTSSQVDLTAVNGVQSLFTKGKPDPWRLQLASDFIDFALWHDQIRYPVAVIADSAHGAVNAGVPPLLADLRRRDPDWFQPDVVVLDEPRRLAPELLEAAIRELGAFAINNVKRVRGFLNLHQSAWIIDQIRSRSRTGTDHLVFDIEAIANSDEVTYIATRLRISQAQVFYLFDLILKYLLYSERATEGHYLTHPIRSKQKFSFLGANLTSKESGDPLPPFFLGPHISKLAQKRGQDWLTSTLHETRGYIREQRMTELNAPGTVSREALWDLANRLGLPTGLKRYETVKDAAVASTSSAGLAALMFTGAPLPAAVGLALSLATSIWSGGVPPQMARVRWVQWMLECPLEGEASGV